MPSKKLKNSTNKVSVKLKQTAKLTDLRKIRAESHDFSHRQKPKIDYVGELKKANKIVWKISAKSLFITCISCTILALAVFFVFLYRDHSDTRQFYSDLNTKYGIELAEIEAKRSMIGDQKQLANEIINYQSAPEDLKRYILKDYFALKANCIVNGNYIAEPQYELVNVVNEQYAKIIRNCGGNDQAVLAKLGGSWALVHAGLSAPMCKDVNSIGIPMGISPTCTDGKVLYPNPNP